jgi:hypothetical protein
LKKASSISSPPLPHHHDDLTGDSIVERPVMRQSTSMQSLQRERKEGLFKEKPSSLLCPDQDSCHQSPTARKRNVVTHQIQPSGSGGSPPGISPQHGTWPTTTPRATLYISGTSPVPPLTGYFGGRGSGSSQFLGGDSQGEERARGVIRLKRIYFPEHFCYCFSSNLCVLNTTNTD